MLKSSDLFDFTLPIYKLLRRLSYSIEGDARSQKREYLDKQVTRYADA